MAADQLPLDLALAPSYSGADFLVAPCNTAAFAWIEKWPDWPGAALALHGPAGCGKSHLTHVWRARSQALEVDVGRLGEAKPPDLLGTAAACILDLGARGASPGLDERALLHLYNHVVEHRRSMLICARTPPARWSVALPDLRSRLAAMPAVAIDAPDDTMLSTLLVKLFADRQLAVDDAIVRYAVARMERSFEAARQLVDSIDRIMLAEQRRPNLAMVRAILADEPDD